MRTGSEIWHIDQLTNPPPTLHHEDMPDSSRFVFMRAIVDTSFPEGDVVTAYAPWLLPFKIELPNPPADRMEQKRIFETLNQHGIECAVVMRAGTVESIAHDSSFNMKRRVDFTIYFADDIQRSAALLIL